MLMAVGAAAEGFWRFSLMIYAQPGIAEALIGLQDRAGHNVNLILFGLWLGLSESARLDAADLPRARAAIDPIDRGVVVPLRSLRRTLKADPDPDMRALRRRILALEIAAERRVQARLVASVARRKPRRGDRRSLAETNLRLILGEDFGSEEVALLRQAIAGF
jgi:uncharacterized protein (TIGR02444 family)